MSLFRLIESTFLTLFRKDELDSELDEEIQSYFHMMVEEKIESGIPEYAGPGIPQGMAALQQYLADVSDESKDFAECEEWFCWAAFERLMARRCSEVWLRSITGHLDGEAAELIAAISPILKKGIEAEAEGLSLLKSA